PPSDRLCPFSRYPVDLGRHHKIILVEPLDLLRPERHGREPPAEADIRVMPLGLGELANPLHKSQRLPEIPEAETALEASRLIEQLPFRGLGAKVFGLIASQRRNPAAARRARLLSKVSGHRVLLDRPGLLVFIMDTAT